MTIINLNKVCDLFVDEIRDNFNVHEKAELVRILINSIEHDYEVDIKSIKNGIKR